MIKDIWQFSIINILLTEKIAKWLFDSISALSAHEHSRVNYGTLYVYCILKNILQKKIYYWVNFKIKQTL